MDNLNKQAIKTAVIKVIGIGGGGCNAVNGMFEDNFQGVELIVANTDAQVLESSPVKHKILLGAKTTRGLGAGANPVIGKESTLETEDEIRAAIGDSDLVFLAAGMGGGTGTGAAPEFARIAKESGSLVVAVVSKPFRIEGVNRQNQALAGISELRNYVDSIIVIPNDRVIDALGSFPIVQSFKEVDSILRQGVRTITDLIIRPSLINCDFADVRSVLKDQGSALFGIGIGEGETKAIVAANEAIKSDLLESTLFGASKIILNITGGLDCSLNDAYDVMDIVQQATGNPDVDIIFGFAAIESLKDKMVVSIIASGFNDGEKRPIRNQPQPSQQSQQQINQNIHQNNIKNVNVDQYTPGPNRDNNQFDRSFVNNDTINNNNNKYSANEQNHVQNENNQKPSIDFDASKTFEENSSEDTIPDFFNKKF